MNPGCITDLCTPDKPPKTAPTEQCKGCFDKLQPNLQSILNTGGGVGLTFAFTMVGHHGCCCKLLFKLLLSSSSSSILFVLLLIALACLDCGCQFLGIWAAHTYRYVSMRACVCGRQRKREGLQHTQTHRHTDTHRHTQTHTDTQTHRHTQTHTDTLSLCLSLLLSQTAKRKRRQPPIASFCEKEPFLGVMPF